MFKNEAGQTLRVLAIDTTTREPYTGDAAKITCKVSKNGGVLQDLTDVNPVEQEDGYYLFSLTQDETDADTLDFFPDSTTADVFVVAVDHDRQTVDRSVPDSAYDSLAAFTRTVGPKRVDTKQVEIEAHNPLMMQKLLERQQSKPVTFGQFPKTKAIPKDASCFCNKDDQEYR